MREKPLATGITLVGGAIAALCCLINRADLLTTLIIVLIALVVFMVIGLIADKVYSTIRDQVKQAQQEELDRLDRERREAQLAAEEAREAEARRREKEADEQAKLRIASLYADKKKQPSLDDLFEDEPEPPKQEKAPKVVEAAKEAGSESSAEPAEGETKPSPKGDDDDEFWASLRG